MARSFAIAFLLLFNALTAFGRGGGESGGYGAHQLRLDLQHGEYYIVPIIGDGAWAFWLIVSIIAVAPSIYAFRKIRRLRKRRKSRKLLKHLMTIDPVWEERRLKEHVKSSFLEIQQAWCDQDLVKLDAMLTSSLFRSWRKRIRKAKKHGHHDKMAGTRVLRCNVINVQDYLNDDRDNFTVELHIFSNGWTLDKKDRVVDQRDPLFAEFWTYRRKGDDWLLDQVRQCSAAKDVLKPNVVEEK